MQGFQSLQADMHGAVNWCPGGGQNADHLKGLVGMVFMIVVMFVQTMAQGDLLAQAITQLMGDLSTDHRLVQAIERP